MKYNDFGSMPLLLHVVDLADTLEIGRNAAYNLANSGQIPIIKIGSKIRVPRDGLIRFIKEGCQSA